MVNEGRRLPLRLQSESASGRWGFERLSSVTHEFFLR
jgi:hypothetical protein